MLNTQTTLPFYKEAYALCYGDNRKVSRALRRFIQRVAPDGAIQQVLREAGSPLSADEVDTYTDCAQHIRKTTCEYLENETGFKSVTHVNAATGQVCNVYPLFITPETASLTELRSTVSDLVSISSRFRDFATDSQRELHRFSKEYHMEQARIREERDDAINLRIAKMLGFGD